jgi:cyclic pyranopterin phosphate synthase
VVRASVQLGIDKIRITGGEPLVRYGMADLVHMISSIEGIQDISMTTNGILLAKYARQLRKAGLRRVNISLDTLKADRFKEITRGAELADTLKGIEAAMKTGLSPIKVNTVLMKGINDDEIIDFSQMTRDAGWHIRFIELMPLNRVAEFVPSNVVRKKIESLGTLEPYTKLTGNGAARYFRLPQAKGTIGFISPVSEPFCKECNRLRLSSTGILFPCLFSKQGLDIKTPIRRGANNEEIKSLIMQAIMIKPKQHHLASDATENKKMSSIGG